MPENELRGVPASRGRVTGPVFRFAVPRTASATQPRRYPLPEDLGVEAARIPAAADLVGARLRDEALLRSGDQGELAAVMAADPSLLEAAQDLVHEQSLPAGRAVWDAVERFATALRDSGGPLSGRAEELYEARDRIIAELDGARNTSVTDPDQPSVLVATELSAEQLAAFDPATVLGVVTETGGALDAVAVAARDRGIPAVLGCKGVSASTASHLYVDADSGLVSPSEPSVETTDRESAPTWSGRGTTHDGFRIPLLADLGSPEDAGAATEARAEGIGLFRSEWCYLATEAEPNAHEQAELYRSVLDVFHGKHVVVRTLDAASDRPLTLEIPAAEPNPALGRRGIRASEANPKLFDAQLSAIAAVTGIAVAPMINTTAQAEWFRTRARAAGVRSAGILFDTPGAALLAETLLAHADFGCIDTDELTQYTMAADRELETVARWADPWQPAVLRLFAEAIRAGHRAGKPVGACGTATADPWLACVLTGLGAADLTMPPEALRAVGGELSRHSLERCRAATHAALAAGDAVHARAAARAELDG